MAELAQLCRDEGWQISTWDIDQGLRLLGQSGGGEPEEAAADPLAAIRTASAVTDGDTPSLVVLTNFHRFLNSAEIIQSLGRQIVRGKQSRTIFIVLSPVVQIPTELEKHFIVIDHPLPSREQLDGIARGIATEDGEMPNQAGLDAVLDAAAGLTRLEAENAFSLSITRDSRITPEAVWELKSGMLKKSGLLQLYRGQEDFSSLGGLSALKAFTRRALLQPRRDNAALKPRGVLMLSPPGWKVPVL